MSGLERIVELQARVDAEIAAQRLNLEWFSGLDEVKLPAQIVRGLLPEGALAVVYGESNSGKTFFTLDLCLAIAAGSAWCGRRTRRGLALYAAGEGAASLRARVAAYRKAHPEVSGGIPFAIVGEAVNFLDPLSIDQLIATVRAAEQEAGEKAAVIVVDTFARSMSGGDENSTQDVGAVIAGADRLRTETGAAVAFIHHAGKDPTRGARGSSALRAAVDTEIFIEGTAGARVATVTKQRDLEAGARLAFTLEAVEVGHDDEGEPITSCIVRHVEADEAATPAARELRGKVQRQLVSSLRVRSETDPDRIWTLGDLRRIGRELGLHRNSARSAVDALVASPYMTPTIGGYLFADGNERPKHDRNVHFRSEDE